MDVFTQRNFVADFIRLTLNFIRKTTNLLFEPPFGGVRGNVRTSSIARLKARGRLPIRYAEHFSLALEVETL